MKPSSQPPSSTLAKSSKNNRNTEASDILIEYRIKSGPTLESRVAILRQDRSLIDTNTNTRYSNLDEWLEAITL